MRVLGNVAMSLDGRIAGPGGVRVRLSGPEDKRRVHQLRHEVDAILVGVGTVLLDDPELLVDPQHAGMKDPRHPLRVILDSRLRTPPGARVLRGPSKTVVFTAGSGGPLQGAEVVPLSLSVDPGQVLRELASRGCRSVLVEGGARVHGSFLRAGLYDRFTVYVAPRLLGEGPPVATPPESLAESKLRLVKAEPLGEGALLEFVRA